MQELTDPRFIALWPEEFGSAFDNMKSRYANAFSKMLELQKRQPMKAARLARFYIQQMNSIGHDPPVTTKMANGQVDKPSQPFRRSET